MFKDIKTKALGDLETSLTGSDGKPLANCLVEDVLVFSNPRNAQVGGEPFEPGLYETSSTPDVAVAEPAMTALKLVNLLPLLVRSRGREAIAIGLVDGPVLSDHPGFAGARIREVRTSSRASCSLRDGVACAHGTFVAGILCGARGGEAPGICPDCTLLVRPVFAETADGNRPATSAFELASAIVECVRVGVRVINLSLVLANPSPSSQRALHDALDYAASRRTIVVAAAGNTGAVETTAVTSHRWVIPVTAFDAAGRLMSRSNVGGSVGRRGLGAPGAGVVSLAVEGHRSGISGTSVAAPFVTGTIALLMSEFPDATADEIAAAVVTAPAARRRTIVPPLLDAWAAYQRLAASRNAVGAGALR